MQNYSSTFRNFATIKKHYDYLVIGAGSGGIASARRAAQHNKKVCVIENKKIGGTCVNVGCVPKKVMWNLAAHIEDGHHYMKPYHLKCTTELDFPAFKKSRDEYIARLNQIYMNNAKNAGIDYVEGMAQFKSSNSV